MPCLPLPTPFQDLDEDLCQSAVKVLRREPMHKGGTAPGILCELAEKVNKIVVKSINGGALEEGVDMGEDGDLEETLDLTEVPAEGEEPGLSDEEEEEKAEEEEGDISEEEEGVMGRPRRNAQQPLRYRDEGMTDGRPPPVVVVPNASRGCSKCRFREAGCYPSCCR